MKTKLEAMADRINALENALDDALDNVRLELGKDPDWAEGGRFCSVWSALLYDGQLSVDEKIQIEQAVEEELDRQFITPGQLADVIETRPDWWPCDSLTCYQIHLALDGIRAGRLDS